MDADQVGFGRLVGRMIYSEESWDDIDIVVKTLPSTLGRADSCEVCFNMNTGSDANTISREHAIITYINNMFTIKCLSKNGCLVDKKFIDRHQEVQLKPKTPIKLGNAYVYWLPARKVSRQSSGSGERGIYGKLVTKAIAVEPLKSKIANKDIGATQREIIDMILTYSPELNADEKSDGNKNKNLMQGIYMHLKNNYGAIKSGNHKDPIRYYISDSKSYTNSNPEPPSKKLRTETQTVNISVPAPTATETVAAVEMDVIGSTSEIV